MHELNGRHVDYWRPFLHRLHLLWLACRLSGALDCPWVSVSSAATNHALLSSPACNLQAASCSISRSRARANQLAVDDAHHALTRRKSAAGETSSYRKERKYGIKGQNLVDCRPRT